MSALIWGKAERPLDTPDPLARGAGNPLACWKPRDCGSMSSGLGGPCTSQPTPHHSLANSVAWGSTPSWLDLQSTLMLQNRCDRPNADRTCMGVLRDQEAVKPVKLGQPPPGAEAGAKGPAQQSTNYSQVYKVGRSSSRSRQCSPCSVSFMHWGRIPGAQGQRCT